MMSSSSQQATGKPREINPILHGLKGWVYVKMLSARFLALWLFAAVISGCSGGGTTSIDPWCTRYIGGSAVRVGMTPTALVSPTPNTYGVSTNVGTVRISSSASVFQRLPFQLTLTLQPASGSAIVQTITIQNEPADFTYSFANPTLASETQYRVFVQDSGLCPRTTPTTSIGAFATSRLGP